MTEATTTNEKRPPVWRPSDKVQAFAQWLADRAAEGKEDRATLAALRRGLMIEDEQLYELYGHVPVRFLAGLNEYESRTYLMVAALFASHRLSMPDPAEGQNWPNFGDALRTLAAKKATPDTPPEEMLPESLKRRVEALLAAPRDELFGHLRQLIRMLESEGVAVPWASLLAHLLGWGHPSRYVQWAWSRSFYVGSHHKGGDE